MGAAQCCAYLVATVLVIVASALLVAMYYQYHYYFTTFAYVPATCVVSKTVYTVQYACDCGTKCRSSYPCLLIYAKLTDTADGSSVEWPIPLYDDDWQQELVAEKWDSEMVEMCTLRTCSRGDNRDGIERYKQRYGRVGTRHPCFFLPGTPYKNGAVLHNRIPWTTGVHMIVWPGLAIAMSILSCVIMCIRQRCRPHKYRNNTTTLMARQQRTSQSTFALLNDRANLYHSSSCL